MQELQRIDPGAASVGQIHAQAIESLRELEAELSHYAERVETDPVRLRQVEERLNLVQSLKRKYGSSVAEVMAFGEEAQRKLTALESRDAELERLNEALKKLESELHQAGAALSALRHKLVPSLSKSVAKELAALRFLQSQFDIALQSEPAVASGQIPSTGFDRIEFQFAPNPGEPLRPLRAIASSGEMARVMLALKKSRTVASVRDRFLRPPQKITGSQQ